MNDSEAQSAMTDDDPALADFHLCEEDLPTLRAWTTVFAEDWEHPGMEAYDELFRRMKRESRTG